MHFASFGGLPPAGFKPDRRLLDLTPPEKYAEGRKDAYPKGPPPADARIEQTVRRTRQQKAEAPRALQDASHKAARSRRPSFHRERGAGRPLGSHADAQQSAKNRQEQKRRRKAGDEIRPR